MLWFCFYANLYTVSGMRSPPPQKIGMTMMDQDQRQNLTGNRYDRKPEPWHFDRRVPLSIILTLILQTAGIVWWAAGENAATHDAIRRIELIEAFDLNVDGQMKLVGDRLARIEERTTDQLHTLERIEDTLRETHRK